MVNNFLIRKINWVLVMSLIALILTGTAVVGEDKTDIPVKDRYWDNLEKRWKFSLQLSWGTVISGYFYTRKVLREFYGMRWFEKREVLNDTFRTLEIRWRDRIPLRLVVRSRGGLFHPHSIYFTQEGEKYEINNYSDLYGFGDYFQETKTSGDGIIRGFLAIPAGIDMSKTFKFVYEGKSVEVGTKNLDIEW